MLCVDCELPFGRVAVFNLHVNHEVQWNVYFLGSDVHCIPRCTTGASIDQQREQFVTQYGRPKTLTSYTPFTISKWVSIEVMV